MYFPSCWLVPPFWKFQIAFFVCISLSPLDLLCLLFYFCLCMGFPLPVICVRSFSIFVPWLFLDLLSEERLCCDLSPIPSSRTLPVILIEPWLALIKTIILYLSPRYRCWIRDTTANHGRNYNLTTHTELSGGKGAFKERWFWWIKTYLGGMQKSLVFEILGKSKDRETRG